MHWTVIAGSCSFWQIDLPVSVADHDRLVHFPRYRLFEDSLVMGSRLMGS
jgi:hypothetical protein